MSVMIIDFSQVAIGSIQSAIASMRMKNMDKEMYRHLILNSLRNVIFKFKSDYKEIVIACDSRKYWRKEIFPHYKAGRKKNREKSDIDWDLLFEVLTEVKADIKTIFPYKIIEVEGAEADDIFGTLVPRLSTHKSVLMVSSDGDFKQLHQYPNVKQFNPMLKIFVKSDNPHQELKEKILTGDFGDGIPSCLSNDDVFVMGIRQKPLTKKIKEKLLSEDFNNPNIDYYKNIQRNKMLIDLTMIPQDIKNKIVEEYEMEQTGSKNLIRKYFIKHRLSMLMECINEF